MVLRHGVEFLCFLVRLPGLAAGIVPESIPGCGATPCFDQFPRDDAATKELTAF